MKIKVFDDLFSLFHFILGVVCANSPRLSLIIVPVFSIYQLLEKEDPCSKVGDFIEFLLGFLVGLILNFCHVFSWSV